MEEINFVIPKKLENLSLPDPDLLHCYEDEDARRIYLEGVIGTEDDPMEENSIGIVKKLLRYNRDDIGIPCEERKPVKIFINSPGGDITYSIILANTILKSKNQVQFLLQHLLVIQQVVTLKHQMVLQFQELKLFLLHKSVH